MIVSSSFSPRADQSKVLTYTTGKMGVSAVPGAGKTFIIKELVLKLIRQGTPPDRIGVSTYTRSARGNLINRLNEHGDYNRVQVFTLHSLSLRILQEFSPIGFSFGLQEDYAKERLIADLVTSWMNLNRSVWQEWTQGNSKIDENKVKKELCECTRVIIRKAKQACLSPWDIKATKSSLLAIGVELYAQYEQRLRERGQIDYDDMVVKAVRLLEDNQYIRTQAQDWFDYLLEDEAQDSTFLQAKLLEILSERSGNLVRVGDPNQSISSTFSNAEPAVFREFCQQHQRHTLNQASRSSPKIIQLANYLVQLVAEEPQLSHLRSAFEQQFITPTDRNPPNHLSTIDFLPLEGDTEYQLARITNLAIDAYRSRPDQTIAILVPRNDLGNKVIDILQREGIKFNDLLRNSNRAKRFINIIYLVTQFLATPTQIETLVTALSAILATYDIPEPQIKLLENSLLAYFPEDLLYNDRVYQCDFPELEDRARDKLYELLKLFAFWLDESGLPWDELLRLIVQKLQQSREDLYAGNYIIQSLHNTFNHAILVDWANISLEIEQMLERNLPYQITEVQTYEPKAGEVAVCTCHSAKGLEWDEVFIVECTAYEFPVFETDRPPPSLDLTKVVLKQWQELFQPNCPIDANADFVELAGERLRLLYVAITRAKKRLTLATPTRWNEKDQPPSFLFDRLAQFNADRSREVCP